ncbi:MAG: hypothetical protein K0R86_1342 [Enterobacter kobei]|jgi:hypothetical protein|nr:hypothetical protein [Enterobacter kobei]SIQ44746.1 hypothetical protein SAMN05444841_101420 [Enterobacter kobei]
MQKLTSVQLLALVTTMMIVASFLHTWFTV